MEPPFNIVVNGLPDPTNPSEIAHPHKEYQFHFARNESQYYPNTVEITIPSIIEEKGGHGIIYAVCSEQEGWLQSILPPHVRSWTTFTVSTDQLATIVSLLMTTPGARQIPGDPLFEEKYYSWP